MKGVVATGAVLVLALAGSFYTWQHKDDVVTDDDKVAMYQASAGDVKKITWKAEDVTVTVEQRKDAAGEYTWVTTREEIVKKKPPAPADTDASDTDAPEPAEEKEVKEQAFLGNDAANKLYKAFSPLLALRELSTEGTTVDPKTFGLDAPKGTILVDNAGATLEMTLGAETYGARDRYVKLGDKVFLVDDQELRPLQYGKTRLVERAVQPLAEADIESIAVQGAGQSVVFVQKNREDREKSYWTREATPDTKDEVGATWLDKLLKIRVQSYPTADEIPAALTSVFTYSITGKKDGEAQTWTVEVLRDDAAAPNPEYYAKSSYDRATVKLTRTLAAEAADDLAAALSGTGPIAPEQPPAEKPQLEMPGMPPGAPPGSPAPPHGSHP